MLIKVKEGIIQLIQTLTKQLKAEAAAERGAVPARHRRWL